MENELLINEEINQELDEVELISPNIRQQDFWKAYLGPKSPTYANAYQSALSVGYTNYTSLTICSTRWFKAKMRRKSLLNKAERVLDKTLDAVTLNKEGIEDAALLRVQNDTAKFIAKTLGKDEGYTERAEVSGKDGQPIVFMPTELMEKFNLKSEVVDEENKEETNEE